MLIAASTAPRMSARDKYLQLREKSRVRVKLVTRPGKEPNWIAATIKDRNKGGAFCVADNGLGAFYHWGDIEPATEAEMLSPLATAPLASLGEVAAAHAARTGTPTPRYLRGLPPYLDPEQKRREQASSPPVNDPPPAPLPTPEPPSVAEERAPDSASQRLVKVERPSSEPPPAATAQPVSDQPTQPETPPRKRTRGKIRPTIPTPIGDTFRSYRFRKGLTQEEFAEAISQRLNGDYMSGSRYSLIERGACLPTDPELVAFSLMSGISQQELAKLRADAGPARTVTRRDRWAPKLIPEPERVTAKQVPVAPPPPAPVAQPNVEATQPDIDPDEFERFVQGLAKLTSIPTDPAKAQLWIRLAARLFELGR